MGNKSHELQDSQEKTKSHWAPLRAGIGLMRRTVVVRVPALLHAEVQALARQDHIPPAAALRMALQRGLGGIRQDRTMEYLVRLTETIVQHAAVDQKKAEEILLEARKRTGLDRFVNHEEAPSSCR